MKLSFWSVLEVSRTNDTNTLPFDGAVNVEK